MAGKIETFEEIEVRVRNQLRNQAVPMKCSNCDFEVADKDVYYNHIVDNHVIEDPDTHREERSTIEDEHKNDIINEETLTEPCVYPPVELTKQSDMAGNEDDDTIVERISAGIIRRICLMLLLHGAILASVATRDTSKPSAALLAKIIFKLSPSRLVLPCL